MPSRRSISVVNNSSPVAAADVDDEVIVLPCSSVDPKKHHMTETTKNNKKITPTPPPKQSKQQTLSLKGSGQLTLAAFFRTKKEINNKDNHSNNPKTLFKADNGTDPLDTEQSMQMTGVGSAPPNILVKTNTTIKKLSVKGFLSKPSRRDLGSFEALPDDATIHDRTACGGESSDSQAGRTTKSYQKESIRELTDCQSNSANSALIDVCYPLNIVCQQADDIPTKTGAYAQSANEDVDNTVTISTEHSDFEHYSLLEKRYMDRQEELIQRANEDSEANEQFPLFPIDLHEDVDVDSVIFPNALVGQLAALVQGSRSPLSDLSKLACQKLRDCVEAKCSKKYSLTLESVAEKIKLIAERKPHFGILPSNKKLDKLEDTTNHFVWRWELTSVELLLNPESVSHVKKVRACRKRLASHYKAIVKLLELIRNNKDVGNAEERVLKFEREEEARRLLKKKELLKKEESQKQKATLLLKKEEEAAKRETEKLIKEKERARLKSLKEEEKRQKEEERLKARLEKEQLELDHLALADKSIQKQKAFMAKFFVHEKLGRNHDVAGSGMGSVEKDSKQEQNHHRVETFWNQLGSSSIPLDFRKGKMKGYCFRRTEHIRVSVTVTVDPLLPSGFYTEDQCYSERRIISVPNKLKFLKFFEDYRPPYHGTWSKPKSKFVSGRHPFGKDESHLNYEIDSEAEWEEEAEDGEDLDSVAKDDEEEDLDEDPGVDTRNYNYADGWLARDAKCELQSEEEGLFSPRCLVAPLFDGNPILSCSFAKEEERNDYILGLPVNEALELLSIHKCIVSQVGEEGLNVCLDPYKPVPEALGKTKADENTSKKEIHRNDLRSFCHFIHGCTLSSKEKIVEEFRKNYPNILCSRAELFRKLDSISVKHRIPRGGTVWEVTQETVDELELTLLKLTPETLVEASDITRNKPNEKTHGTNETSNTNGAKRKHIDSLSTESKPFHMTGASAPHFSETFPVQELKKKKRITPVSLGASAALFATFLNKANVTNDQGSSLGTYVKDANE